MFACYIHKTVVSSGNDVVCEKDKNGKSIRFFHKNFAVPSAQRKMESVNLLLPKNLLEYRVIILVRVRIKTESCLFLSATMMLASLVLYDSAIILSDLNFTLISQLCSRSDNIVFVCGLPYQQLRCLNFLTVEILIINVDCPQGD